MLVAVNLMACQQNVAAIFYLVLILLQNCKSRMQNVKKINTNIHVAKQITKALILFFAITDFKDNHLVVGSSS